IGSPVFDQGTSSYTTHRQVVAEELMLPYDRIDSEVWNTDSVPFDAGVAGSRQTRLSTIVAYEAAQDTKRAIVRFVAEKKGWPEESLTFHGDEVWRTDIEERVNWWALL